MLSDKRIRALCVPCEANNYSLTTPPLISPFSEPVDEPDTISFGLSSAGYDLRLSGAEVWVFNPCLGEVIDPKKMKDPDYREKVFIRRTMLAGEPIVIPANSYILGRSFERFHMPRNLCGVCVGKSTLARVGVIINTTPIEPSWEGVLTIEIANVSGMPLKVYAMEGIAQVQFHDVIGEVERCYKTKRGKYDGQEGVTSAIVK